MTATLASGGTLTYRAPVSSHLLEITEHLHVVSILVTLSNCQSMTQLIIPTGIMVYDKNYQSYGYSPCLINGNALMTAEVLYYTENKQLMVKLSFKEPPIITSMTIKLNTIFHVKK